MQKVGLIVSAKKEVEKVENDVKKVEETIKNDVKKPKNKKADRELKPDGE